MPCKFNTLLCKGMNTAHWCVKITHWYVKTKKNSTLVCCHSKAMTHCSVLYAISCIQSYIQTHNHWGEP